MSDTPATSEPAGTGGAAAAPSARTASWVAVAILASAQFVMVLDSSVMNVSISQICADLGTTVQGVQTAITLYTLVMAAFMLVGAKLGDILGRDRTFAIGLVVYATGSAITAISPNLAVLLFGWSLVEGLGAVLVVPAIAALIAANYEGKQRALAYGIIGGVAAAAVAAGPLIGGWVTTTFTWRLVFIGEVVIVAVILLFRKRMRPSPKPARTPQLDVVGAAFSASGLGLIVFAILMSSTWGWVQPLAAPTIGGQEITPLGFWSCRSSSSPGWACSGLRGVGGATAATGSRRAARPRDAQDRDAQGRPDDARHAAARPARDLLRPARLPAGRPGPRRVRDREAAHPDVRDDARRGARRAAGGREAFAEARRAGRPGGPLGRGADPARDD